MSIQLGILHILASHPDGWASVASINADVCMLSGPDWSRKLRELARRSGPINLFRDGLVAREAGGWRITPAGRTLIASLDVPAAEESHVPVLRVVSSQRAPIPVTTERPRLSVAKTAQPRVSEAFAEGRPEGAEHLRRHGHHVCSGNRSRR
jgi:hypothetical protein